MLHATAPLANIIAAQQTLRDALETRLTTELAAVLARQGLDQGLPLENISNFPLPVELQNPHAKHGLRLDRLHQFGLSYDVLNREGYAKNHHTLNLYDLSVPTLLLVLDYLETYGHLLQRVGVTHDVKQGPGKPNRK